MYILYRQWNPGTDGDWKSLILPNTLFYTTDLSPEKHDG